MPFNNLFSIYYPGIFEVDVLVRYKFLSCRQGRELARVFIVIIEPLVRLGDSVQDFP